MSHVGEEVRRLRLERGWPQPRLSVEAGIAVSAISQIENGRRNPNAGTLKKLAKALEVEVPDLFPKVQPRLEDTAESVPPSPEVAAEAEKLIGLPNKEIAAYAEGLGDAELDEVIYALHYRFEQWHKVLRSEKEAGRQPSAEVYRQYGGAATPWFILTLSRDLRRSREPEAERMLEALTSVR